MVGRVDQMFYVREDRDQRVKTRWLEFRTSREEEKQRWRNGENGGSPFINDNMSRYTGKGRDRATNEQYQQRRLRAPPFFDQRSNLEIPNKRNRSVSR